MSQNPQDNPCTKIRNKADFMKRVHSLLDNNPEGGLLNWPDAEAVFNGLDKNMREFLVQVAHEKTPKYRQATIDCLFELGLISKENSSTVIKKELFAEWILLNRTMKGRFSKPWYWLRHRGSKSYVTSASPHPGWLVFWAIFSLGLPILLMLIPLLSWPMPLWVEQLFSDDSPIDPYRDVALLFVLIAAIAYLFFWLTRHSMVNELKLILGVVAVSLTVLWLGFPLYLVVLIALVSFFDLLALYLFHRADRAFDELEGDNSNTTLRQKVRQIVDEKEWKDPRRWTESRLILVIVLTLTGLLVFSFIVTPREYSLPPDQGTSALVLAPSWLSYRDEGTIVMATQVTTTTLVSGTVLLEPRPGNLIHVMPPDQEKCSPDCAWGPLRSAMNTSQWSGSAASQLVASLESEYAVLEWKVRTAARGVFSVEPKWYLRLQTCQQTEGTTMSCGEPQTISVNRIRIGFRLWGFLEEQPLVNVLSLVFGIVYAVVQIMVSNRFIFGQDGSGATPAAPS